MLRKASLAVLFALLLPVAAFAGDEENRWLHVAVDDGDERVRVNVPLTVVTAALPLIEHEHMRHGRVRIDDVDMDAEDIVTLLRAVRDAEDGEYVTVEDRHDRVRVSKEGEYLHIDVAEDWEDEDTETVKVRMPIAVLSALVSGADDELDILAALDALSEYEGEDLITVNDDGAAVRIWVDRENASRKED